MITIKTLWLYAAIIASLIVGTGAGYVAAPSSPLRLSEEQLARIERECAKSNEYKDAEVIHSPGQEF